MPSFFISTYFPLEALNPIASFFSSNSFADITIQCTDNKLSLKTSVLRDDTSGEKNCLLNDPDAGKFTFTEILVALQRVEGAGGIQKRDTATNDDALGDGSLRGAQGVSHSVLNLTHFNFGSSSDLDNSDTSLQLRQTLLQLFLVVGGLSCLDLLLDHFGALLDTLLGTLTVQQYCVILGDSDILDHPKDALDRFGSFPALIKIEAGFLRHKLTAREDSDVLENSLAIVTKRRRLDATDLEVTA